MPVISVIVPVYNVEQYLQRCVDSILAQTFTDFELILVDDGSPDNCGRICDEYAKKDSRIRVIHQENRGQASARNRAITDANGEWIHFVDSDDMIHPEMLRVLFEAAIENNVSISMCFAHEGQTITEDYGLKHDYRTSIIGNDEDSFLELIEKGEHQFWIVWAKLIRKDILQKNLFCEGRIFEDNAIVHRWLYEAKRSAVVDSRLYFYRANPIGTTKSEFSLSKLDYLWALEEIILTFSRVDYRILRKQFCSNYISSCCNYYTIVQRIPQRSEGERVIRNGLRRILRNNIRYVSLSKAQRISVMEILHPRFMYLYWLGKATLCTLKKDGLVSVGMKVLRRIKNR